MRLRLCDKCKSEIKKRDKYIMCQEVLWNGQMMKVNRIGDICLKCWENIKKVYNEADGIPSREYNENGKKE